MAIDDDSGKPARFPCLAILRYVVATVVTVLAVVVIVMVITVAVRPEDVSVSVVQGYVSTSALWKETTYYAVPTAAIGRQRGSYCTGGDPYSGFDSSCSGGDGIVGGGVYGRPPTRTAYTPVEALGLQVVLSVDNLSGRGSIYCQSINVSFHAGGGGDSGSSTATAAAGMEIGEFHLQSSLDFHVKPHTSHKVSRTLTVYNKTVLTYIASTYGGESSFTGAVEVTMNTSSVVTMGHRTSPITVKLLCSPVDFGVGNAAATATATSVQCIKSN